MSDDPDELQAALDQLQAEQDRRIKAKIEAGTAVRGTPTIVGGPESDIEEARDPQGREIVFGADDIGIIYTGVPRYGRQDDAYYARLQREREVPDKPLANAPRVEPSSVPPPLLRTAPQAEKPPEPKRIVVQTRECEDYNDPGAVVEGYYDIRGSVL